jgi:hypothetical protein
MGGDDSEQDDERPEFDWKKFLVGINLLLKHLASFIPYIPAEGEHAKQPFVLCHPDFNLQNFIVDDGGRLLAIIDWDGVDSRPRTAGCEHYPLWITEDWNFANGPVRELEIKTDEGGDQQDDEPGLPSRRFKDTPADMRRYRGIYREIMARKRREFRIQQSSSTAPGQTWETAEAVAENDIDFTKTSLIIGKLMSAAYFPPSADGIVAGIIYEMGRHWEGEEELNIYDLVDDVLDGHISDGTIELMRQAFLKLLAEDRL